MSSDLSREIRNIDPAEFVKTFEDVITEVRRERNVGELVAKLSKECPSLGEASAILERIYPEWDMGALVAVMALQRYADRQDTKDSK